MVAKKHTDQLKRIKKNVEKSVSYFRRNNQRYHEFRKFVFNTQLSEDDVSLLQTLQKPQLEFNILNAYISRLCGEFSKQEPSIVVKSNYGAPVDPQMIMVIEAHIRHILAESAKDSTQYEAYKDTLSGGFSVFKVWTEYENNRSFDQVIRFGKVFEPTMCGFDPLAKLPHKGDGQYCYEYYPYTKEEFKREFPGENIDDLEYCRETEEFNWAYQNDREDILIVCDYYEKKHTKRKLVKLANGASVYQEEYEEELAKWLKEGNIEQAPAIVEVRDTDEETIVRYRFIGTKVLDYKKLNYANLPLIFVDGDSAMLKDSDAGNHLQFTKPYIYHARGAQRLKNFAGQTLANEIENLVQHKFKVAEQSLPQQEDYLDAYTNVQQASVLVYNAFANNDPDKPIPPPMEINRTPTPPEVTNAFSLTDSNIQMILGSYDAALGINDNELSGIAIVEGATQSNAAAMPYVVSYMHALNQVAQCFLDLIPKYYKTARTIPVQGMNGKRGYALINHPKGIGSVMYDPSVLSVQVEAGVNFEVQKSRALMQINAMMQSSPLFAQFINENVDIVLDNMSFRNSDIVKQRAEEWVQQQKQARQQAQQQAANQPNPDVIKAQLEAKKLEFQGKKLDADTMMKEAQIDVDKQKVDAMKMDSMVKAGESINNMHIAMRKAEAEEMRAKADLHMNVRKQIHTEVIDHSNLKVAHHKLHLDHKKLAQDKEKKDAPSKR